ncbi:MAG: sigma-70 family RNA polymerase sigma factor [Thermoleophilaceae bacterium]|jgi:RNA polymerase sigma-70 factor (ECF subfamily)
MLGSHQAAEDALQEALLRAWRGLPSFEGRGSVRSWLYRIATNAALDAMKSRDHAATSIELVSDAEASTAPQLDAALEEREALRTTMAAALELLPPIQLAVLILRALAGFSAPEVADLLGTTVPAVNSSLQRARATLRDARSTAA